jgi:hypothetical protein
MSANHPKADIREREKNVRYVPKADSCTATKSSLNYLVGTRKQCRWNFDAERPGGSQINDEVELGRLDDRQLGRLGALKDPTSVDAELPKHFGEARTVAHEAPSLRILAHCMDRGDRMARGQRGKLGPTKEEEGIGADYECIGLVAGQGREGSLGRHSPEQLQSAAPG